MPLRNVAGGYRRVTVVEAGGRPDATGSSIPFDCRRSLEVLAYLQKRPRPEPCGGAGRGPGGEGGNRPPRLPAAVGPNALLAAALLLSATLIGLTTAALLS